MDAVSIFIDINKWIIDINKDDVGHITKRMLPRERARHARLEIGQIDM